MQVYVYISWKWWGGGGGGGIIVSAEPIDLEILVKSFNFDYMCSNIVLTKWNVASFWAMET